MYEYPISLLTGAALLEGALEALTACYEAEFEMTEADEITEEDEAMLQERAHLALTGICADVQDILGVKRVSAPLFLTVPRSILMAVGRQNDLKRCRVWLQRLLDE